MEAAGDQRTPKNQQTPTNTARQEDTNALKMDGEKNTGIQVATTTTQIGQDRRLKMDSLLTEKGRLKITGPDDTETQKGRSGILYPNDDGIYKGSEKPEGNKYSRFSRKHI